MILRAMAPEQLTNFRTAFSKLLRPIQAAGKSRMQLASHPSQYKRLLL
jgi:hypothetical protein